MLNDYFQRLNRNPELFRVAAYTQAGLVPAMMLYASTRGEHSTLNALSEGASKVMSDLKSLWRPQAERDTLVGVEPNPGPKSKGSKAVKKLKKQIQQKSKNSNGPTAMDYSSKLNNFGATLGSAMPLQGVAGAYSTAGRNFIKFSSASYIGRDGLRVMGCQRLCDVSAAAVDGHIYFENIAANGQISNDNNGAGVPRIVRLSPIAWGGTIFQIASAFMRYRIRSCSFEYNTTTTTTNAGNLCLGIDADASNLSSATPELVTQLASSIETAPWSSFLLSAAPELDTKTVYYCANAVVSAATDYRFAAPGSLLSSGNLSVVPSSPYAIGNVYVYYDIELYCPGIYTSFDISDKSRRLSVDSDHAVILTSRSDHKSSRSSLTRA